jgi:hypothetical protein
MYSGDSENKETYYGRRDPEKMKRNPERMAMVAKKRAASKYQMPAKRDMPKMDPKKAQMPSPKDMPKKAPKSFQMPSKRY